MKSLLKQHKVLTKDDLLKINGGYGGSSGGGSCRGYSGCSGGGTSSSGSYGFGRTYCAGSYRISGSSSSSRIGYSSSSSGGSTSSRLDYGKLSAPRLSDDMLRPTCPGYSHPKNPFETLKF